MAVTTDRANVYRNIYNPKNGICQNLKYAIMASNEQNKGIAWARSANGTVTQKVSLKNQYLN